MIYIASPYSSPIEQVREDNAYQAGAFAAHCFNRGHVVYSPIASWHWVAMEHKLKTDFDSFRRLNYSILRHCTEFWILQLDGWDTSTGVTEESIMANSLYIPRRHFDGDNFQEVV